MIASPLRTTWTVGEALSCDGPYRALVSQNRSPHHATAPCGQLSMLERAISVNDNPRIHCIAQ